MPHKAVYFYEHCINTCVKTRSQSALESLHTDGSGPCWRRVTQGPVNPSRVFVLLGLFLQGEHIQVLVT